jgi:hypothetical protein
MNTSVICYCIVNKASSVRVANVSELSNGRGYVTSNYSRREFVHFFQFQRGSNSFASHFAQSDTVLLVSYQMQHRNICFKRFVTQRVYTVYKEKLHKIFLLTFQSLAVSLLTTRFNIQKFYMVLALR